LRLRFFYGVTLGEAEVPERIAYASEPAGAAGRVRQLEQRLETLRALEQGRCVRGFL
jgi:hypothetical protein